MAEYGWAMIFFYAFACIVFFIPCSLVSAELATGWPETGGVYVWVKEAFGPRTGFFAAWIFWTTNVAWIPSQLAFIAGAVAYLFNPELVYNRAYMVGMVLSQLWFFIILNLKGMRISGLISTLGATVGTIIPGAFFIGLGVYWALSGEPLAITFSPKALLPDLGGLSQIAFLAGTLLALSGMELSAVHAREVKNPQRDYPKAIFISSVLILGIYILGSLAVALVVPKEHINLVDGVLYAFADIFRVVGMPWMMLVIASMIIIGSVATLSTWIVGPVKSLLATSLNGDLPLMFQKVNKHHMPANLMIAQGVIVSALSLIFLLMPSVESAYWVLFVMTAQLYLLMYLFMFAAAIILRYRKPAIHRSYRVPGGNFGMNVIAGLGFVGCLFAFCVGFVPPGNMDVSGFYIYEGILIVGLVLLCIPPFLLHRYRKPEWKQVPVELDEDL